MSGTRARASHDAGASGGSETDSSLVLANNELIVVEFTERRVRFRYPYSRKPVVETTWGILLLRALGA